MRQYLLYLLDADLSEFLCKLRACGDVEAISLNEIVPLLVAQSSWPW